MQKLFLIIFSILISGFIAGQEIKKVKITDLEKTIAEAKTPMIINFWATWCRPCLEEIPYFMDQAKKHAGDSLQLLLISLDMEDAYPADIKNTIINRNISVPVQWLDETNADYFCPRIDTRWSGAIPASLFINHKTGYRKFIEEQLSEEQLKKEISALLGIH